VATTLVASLALAAGACAGGSAIRPAPGGNVAVPAAAPAVDLPVIGNAQSPTRLVLVADGNEARYRAREQVLNIGLRDVTGASRLVSGAIVVNPDATIAADQSRIVVNLEALATNSANRDNDIKQNYLQVTQFPNAEFVARQASGAPSALPTSGSATFQLLGDLTVHGVTQPTTWDVTMQFQPSGGTGTASTRTKITDYGMRTPSTASILSVDDDITLELDFTVSSAPGA
jgi:polyisoprenoid-binding protein YceI